MSSVRMCDQCGNIFSEREDGWGTYTGAVVKRNAHGKQEANPETLDSCPRCTSPSIMTPRVAIGETPIDRVARTLTEAEISAQLG